jgi:hypothetical protein
MGSIHATASADFMVLSIDDWAMTGPKGKCVELPERLARVRTQGLPADSRRWIMFGIGWSQASIRADDICDEFWGWPATVGQVQWW